MFYNNKMGDTNHEITYANFSTFLTTKIVSLEQTLIQAAVNFRDLILEFEQLHLQDRKFKEMYLTLKENLASPKCINCEELKKCIANKYDILDSIGPILTTLKETKDLNLIDGILKLMYRNTTVLTPPSSGSPEKIIKESKDQHIYNRDGCNSISPKVTKDDVNNDESVSEIEGTPTGRKSPIFQSKKQKSNQNLLSGKDKKKCPESWSTPEKKSIKLSFQTPSQSKSGGRMRQGRLSLVKLKCTNVVDLTCSPGSNTGQSCSEPKVQCFVKADGIDNEETILPSPTSGPVKLSSIYKSMSRNSPMKSKSAPKIKILVETSESNIYNNIPNNGNELLDSINILNQVPDCLKSPLKEKNADYTDFGDESISLLQQVKKIENKENNSPSKRPLNENLNIVNVQTHENEANISILQRDPIDHKDTKVNSEAVKRLKANAGPVYKEPAVRKKLEKRALPGWSCEECKNFYDELYRDNPDMLAQKMDECSKHRGRNNPIRPKTPEGFWNPRWDVPEDTEEFNRRNNAV